MRSVIIGYDLNNPGKDYSTLIAAIKKLGGWWHCLDSTWIVKSDVSREAIRNSLMPLLDKNDEIFVGILNGTAAWAGFDSSCSDWLKANL